MQAIFYVDASHAIRYVVLMDEHKQQETDMDAVRPKRAFPGYTLAELKAVPNKTEAILKEIEARETGRSVQVPTPQIEGGAVKIRIGRM